MPDVKSGQERPGRWGGGRHDNPGRRYMIYVVNSARYSLARHVLRDWEQGFGVFLIADECHRYASPENRRIFDFLEEGAGPYYSMGLSATPEGRGFGSVLEPALGKMIYRYGFSEAAANRNVSRFAAYQIALSFTPEEWEEYDAYGRRIAAVRKRLLEARPALRNLGRHAFFEAVREMAAEAGDDPESKAVVFLRLVYDRQQLTYLASARIPCALALVDALSRDAQILVFGERISQAQALYERLNARYPGKAAQYHSGISDQARKNAMDGFRDGRIRILVNCRGLDEGMDVPAASVGIVLSGSSVSRQHIQRLGRIIRKNGEKSMACMYYLYVRESSEDGVFLPDLEEEFPVCNLTYLTAEGVFVHPEYEACAAKVLEKARLRGGDARELAELRRCLEAGLLRPDWLLSREEIREKLDGAVGRKERNYWRCMGEMKEVREGRRGER